MFKHRTIRAHVYDVHDKKKVEGIVLFTLQKS